MGIFSNNRTILSNESFPDTEVKTNIQDECAMSILENSEEDLSFFNDMIERDICEAMYESGNFGIQESAIEVVNENVLTNVWGRIVKFFTELKDKIKKLWASLVTKIKGTFTNDNKKLAEAMKPKIEANKDALAKMKYTAVTFKGVKKSDDADSIVYILRAINENIDNADDQDAISAINPTNDYIDGLDLGDAKSNSDIRKAMDTKFYAEEKKETGAYEYAQTCLAALNEDPKAIIDSFGFKKYLDECDKKISEAKAAEKAAKKAESGNSEQDKAEYVKSLARAAAKHKAASAYKNFMNMASTAKIGAYKKYIKNARSMVIKAASTTHSESAELFNAIDESCDFDVETAFGEY